MPKIGTRKSRPISSLHESFDRLNRTGYARRRVLVLALRHGDDLLDHDHEVEFAGVPLGATQNKSARRMKRQAPTPEANGGGRRDSSRTVDQPIVAQTSCASTSKGELPPLMRIL